MFYVDSNYNNYKYLVSASDNYICLSSSSGIEGTWDDPDTVRVIYQYLNPSVYVIETTYSSNTTRSFPNVSSQITSTLYDRADFPSIFMSGFICLVIYGFILNQLTKLVKKGGAFGSN